MKVKFLPSGEEHEIEFNETILHLAQRVGLHIQSVCKGIPSCAECRIQIVEGEHHVLPPSKKEIGLIGTAHYVDLSRLSCQLRCFGDVTVDLSEQIEKQERMKIKPNDRMARRDGEESRAVLGGILDKVVAADAEIPEEDLGEDIERVEVEAVRGQPKLDKKDSFYGDFYDGKKKNKSGKKKRRSGKKASGRNRNQNNNSNKQEASSEGSGSSKKKRNRRRRRKPKGGGASNNSGNS